MKIKMIKCAIAASCVLSFGFLAEAHEHEHEHAHFHAHHHEHLQAVQVDASTQRTLALKTVRVARRRMASTLTFTGRYELLPDARLTVATPVAGRLTLNVRSLQQVKRGDVLFTVEAPALVARAREIAILEKRLQVYREIKRPNAALENELAVKRAEREALLAQAEEKDGVVSVRAPEDGQVDALPVQSGAWLETGTAVIRLLRPNALRFKALTTAATAARLADGLPATIADGRGTIRLGVGNNHGIVPVYVVFEKIPTAARPGERAQMTCVTDDSEKPVVAVPTAGIVQIGLAPTVFVRDEHDPARFLAFPVTPGPAQGGWTAVGGLPDDDDLEIVTDGAYELKLALPSSANKPTGHFHADGTFHDGEDEK